jgi:2-succinyl-6-hydroxy-2,4-cyclohexadiene-1-carboxylate synthase
MLLVHGMLGGRTLWTENLEALRTVVRPVIVELYGHGRSPSPEAATDYTPAAYLEAFERVRTEVVQAERWYLLGQSLGAALTLRYALAHPDRVIGHVFTNSASGLADAAWCESVVANVASSAERLLDKGVGSLVETKLNPARSHRVVPSVRAALAADEPLFESRGIAGTMRWTTPKETLRGRLQENVPPVLLVSGTREQSFAEPTAYAEGEMANLTVVRVDAGHSPNAERPDEFNRLVTDFVRATA